MKINKHSLAITSLCLVALLLSLYFFVGYYMSDDMSYWIGITKAGAHFKIPNMLSVGQSRWGLWLPNSIIVALFGTTKLTFLLIYLHMILYFIGTVIFSFLTFRTFSEVFPSVIGASLILFNPIFYTTSSTLLPDIPMTFYLTLALYLTLKFGIHGHNKRAFLYTVLIGFTIGIAYATKETALLAIPIFGLTYLFFRDSFLTFSKKIVLLATGILIPLVIDAGVCYLSLGDLNLRIFASMQSNTAQDALQERKKQQGVSPVNRVKFSLKTLNSQWKNSIYLILLILFFGGIIIYNLGDRSQKQVYLLFLLSFIFFYMYLTVGTTSLKEYRPPPIGHARYLSYLFVLLGGILTVTIQVLRKTYSFGFRASQIIAVSLALFFITTLNFRIPFASDVYRACEFRSLLKAFSLASTKNDKRSIYVSPYIEGRLNPIKPYFWELNWDAVMTNRSFPKESKFYFMIQTREAPSAKEVKLYLKKIAPDYKTKLVHQSPIVSYSNNVAWLKDFFGSNPSFQCSSKKGIWLGEAYL